jgi:hypothetical protein
MKIKLCSFATIGLLNAVLFLQLLVSTVQAQTGSENQNSFGQLCQLNSGVTAFNNTACGPTAVANGLIYLNTVAGGGLFSNYNPNSYTTVNDLATAMGTGAGGTSYGTSNPSLVSGLYNYIGSTGLNPAPNVSIVGGQYIVGTGASIPGTIAGNFSKVVPTAQTMADWLNANDAVEFMIQWGTYGGIGGTNWTASGNQHFATLTSLSLTAGDGTLNFWDPWGSGTNGASATAQFQTATVQTIGGYLYLTGISTNDPTATLSESSGDSGDAVSGETGRIVANLAEAVVPEPTSFAILTLSAIAGLAAKRLRRR